MCALFCGQGSSLLVNRREAKKPGFRPGRNHSGFPIDCRWRVRRREQPVSPASSQASAPLLLHLSQKPRLKLVRFAQGRRQPLAHGRASLLSPFTKVTGINWLLALHIVK